MKYINFVGSAAGVEKEINDWLRANSVKIVNQTHVYESMNYNLIVGIFYITQYAS